MEEETGDPWGMLASPASQISELQVLETLHPKPEGGECLEKVPGVIHTLVHVHKHYNMHKTEKHIKQYTMEHNTC